jgi:tetratricopeptide (TPR) repeat protein
MLLGSCFFGGSASTEFEKGVALANEGKTKLAFKAFKAAAQKAPDSARYHFAAAQTAPDQNTAFMYTKAAWEKGFKNKAVFYLLLKLSFHVDKEKKLEYALNLLKELPDSVATDVFRGDIYFEFGKADKAYELWNQEFQKTRQSALCPKIGQALARSGKSDQAIEFLTQCTQDKVLDAEGYSLLASLHAMKFNFKEVDRLFGELQSSNLYNDALRLDQATYLVFNGRFEEASALLSRRPGPGSTFAQSAYGLRFHTLRIYSKILQSDRAGVNALLDVNQQDTVFKGKIDTLIAAVKLYINNDTAAYAALLSARRSLPPDPVTVVLNARAAQQKKMFKEAVALYEQLPALVLWSPQIVAERASAVALAGNDDQALSIISFMHKQRIFSRQSLELFRNLTLKKDLVDKSEAAQKFLEERYSNDVGLKWKGLLLAIREGKTDSALGIARQLRSTYPDDERFEITALSLLLMKKEYRQVLDDAAKSKLPAQKIKPIEAAAFKGLGDTAAAIGAYEAAVKTNKDPMLMMQLAELYFQKKAYDRATGLYTKLLDDTASPALKDSLKIAVLLNNNAWTLMTAGSGDLSGALAMAKKAYDLVPQNFNIIDTYASIMLEAKKFKECIALIEPDSKALSQKRLLCHLSKAYEQRGDKNKAKRYLEDALKLKKEDQKLSELLSDEQIQAEIARLSADER